MLVWDYVNATDELHFSFFLSVFLALFSMEPIKHLLAFSTALDVDYHGNGRSLKSFEAFGSTLILNVFDFFFSNLLLDCLYVDGNSVLVCRLVLACFNNLSQFEMKPVTVMYVSVCNY